MNAHQSTDDLLAHLLSRVERWCLAPANDDDLRALFDLRTDLAFLEFIEVENKIREYDPVLPNRSAFSSFREMAGLPHEAVYQTLTHPVALLWSKTSLRFLQNFSPSPEALQKLKSHLDGFAPLAVAAHALSGRECVIQNVKLPETFSLPGLGLLITRKSPEAINLAVKRDGEAATIILGDSSKHVTIPADRRFAHDMRIQGDVEAIVFPVISTDIPITLEYAEPMLRKLYPMVSGETGNIDVALWREKLQRSFGLIQQVWPEMYDQLVACVSVIVPTSAGLCRQHSTGSDRDAWRSINTTLVTEPYFSDGIIHEHRHDFLNTLALLEDIFADGFDQVEAYYSPWRPEPRPPIGIFHAVFVFTSVAELYRRILLTPDCQIDVPREQLLSDFGMQTLKLRIGIAELSVTAQFSHFGKQVLQTLSKEAERLYQEARKLKAFATPTPATEVRQHYTAWRQSWNRSATAEVETMIL